MPIFAPVHRLPMFCHRIEFVRHCTRGEGLCIAWRHCRRRRRQTNPPFYYRFLIDRTTCDQCFVGLADAIVDANQYKLLLAVQRRHLTTASRVSRRSSEVTREIVAAAAPSPSPPGLLHHPCRRRRSPEMTWPLY